MANIYEINCKNKKNVTTWVYSYKRSEVILTSINGSKAKVKFMMNQKTSNSFKSEGVLSKLKTSVVYTQNNNELSTLQPSLRGKNMFFQCNNPKILKKE